MLFFIMAFAILVLVPFLHGRVSMFLEFSHFEMTALPVKVRGVGCYLPRLTVLLALVAGFWFEQKVSVQFMKISSSKSWPCITSTTDLKMVTCTAVIGSGTKFQPCHSQCILQILLHFTLDCSEIPDWAQRS